tara:strand:- start:98 stop:331 length:234 start_codon:yes stop_codon:yes gene_type:complete
MDCWHCGNELIWGGDDDMEHLEKDGIITNLSCPDSECETHVEVYHYFDDDDDVMNFGPAGGNWGALTFGTHQSDEKK